jgi:hypothetical protein
MIVRRHPIFAWLVVDAFLLAELRTFEQRRASHARDPPRPTTNDTRLTDLQA